MTGNMFLFLMTVFFAILYILFYIEHSCVKHDISKLIEPFNNDGSLKNSTTNYPYYLSFRRLHRMESALTWVYSLAGVGGFLKLFDKVYKFIEGHREEELTINIIVKDVDIGISPIIAFGLALFLFAFIKGEIRSFQSWLKY